MTVAELIKALESISDKSVEVLFDTEACAFDVHMVSLDGCYYDDEPIPHVYLNSPEARIHAWQDGGHDGLRMKSPLISPSVRYKDYWQLAFAMAWGQIAMAMVNKPYQVTNDEDGITKYYADPWAIIGELAK